MPDVAVIRERDALGVIRELVDQQEMAVNCLQDEFRPWLSTSEPDDLSRLPKKGKVQCNNETWTFSRHGAGVSFYTANGTEINAHVAPLSFPRCFDAWRLAIYLEGKCVKKICWGQEEFEVNDRNLERFLQTLESSGVVAKCSPNLYKLR
jgi:hypothetical protein